MSPRSGHTADLLFYLQTYPSATSAEVTSAFPVCFPSLRHKFVHSSSSLAFASSSNAIKTSFTFSFLFSQEVEDRQAHKPAGVNSSDDCKHLWLVWYNIPYKHSAVYKLPLVDSLRFCQYELSRQLGFFVFFLKPYIFPSLQIILPPFDPNRNIIELYKILAECYLILQITGTKQASPCYAF